MKNDVSSIVLNRLHELCDRSEATTDDERRDIQTLPVQLTPNELLDMGKDSAAKARQKQDLERDLDNFKKRMKAEIEALDGSIAINNDCLNTGKQDRAVECVTILDCPKRGHKTTFRLDTLATVQTQTMSSEETQRMMRFMADKEKGESDKPLPTIGSTAPAESATAE